MSSFFDWLKVKKSQPPDDWKRRRKAWKSSYDTLTAANPKLNDNPWDNRDFHISEAHRKLVSSSDKPYGFAESLPESPAQPLKKLRIRTSLRDDNRQGNGKSFFSPLTASTRSPNNRSFISPLTSITA